MSTQVDSHAFLTLPGLEMGRWAHPIGIQAQLIGRGVDCDLQLPDPTVSQRHAKIWTDESGRVFIADLNSRNGVRLNGKRLEADPVVVQPGDLIRLGMDTWLLLRQPNEAYAQPSPDNANNESGPAAKSLKKHTERTINAHSLEKWNVGVAVTFARLVDQVCKESGAGLFTDDILGLNWLFQSLCRRGDMALAWKEIVFWLQDQTNAVCIAFACQESELEPWRISESATRRDDTAGEAPTVRIDQLLARSAGEDQAAAPQEEWSIAVPVQFENSSLAIYGVWDECSLRSPVDCRWLIRLCADLAATLASLHAKAVATQRGHESKVVANGDSVERVLSSQSDADHELLETIARSDVGVLVTGETGVGKEFHAKEIHRLSGRSGPFVACHCAAIPDSLVEDELFGHVKGAYTGANRERRGYFEQANGGTLFLDEIGDAPPSFQVKLLRAIQDKQIQRIGDERSVDVDVRIIAASHRDLRQMMQDGRFREDLYFRLAGEVIRRPPLRDQSPAEIRALIDQILGEMSGDLGPLKFTDAAYEKLLQHDWPGNIRELQSVISRATRRARQGKIDAGGVVFERPGTNSVQAESLDAHQKQHALKTLARVNGNKTEAARILGIDRGTLRRRLRSWGITGESL